MAHDPYLDFEEALRTALPALSDAPTFERDLDLRSYGMDSLATLRVLLALEETYEISVPDEYLSVATFATPASLWNLVTTLSPTAAAA